MRIIFIYKDNFILMMLVVLRIYVALAVFQPYHNLEVGDHRPRPLPHTEESGDYQYVPTLLEILLIIALLTGFIEFCSSDPEGSSVRLF